MDVHVEPGKYVAAVSGGVDSMVLLSLLREQPNIELIVAHYDHGIRQDSAEDRILVQGAAAQYGLPFISEEGKLGPHTSEATAREARYDFLERVRKQENAQAIITAHHQDDVLETAILNLRRGTGRKGLTALASTLTVVRPLLHLPKQTIVEYAKAHNVQWHEDSTNLEEKYVRNYIRHNVLPKFDAAARNAFLDIIERTRTINAELDAELQQMLKGQPARNELKRGFFIQLPHKIAKEFLATWLRSNGTLKFDAKTIERLVIAAKTGQPGTAVDVTKGVSISIQKHELALVIREC